jgi:hypothetical protein
LPTNPGSVTWFRREEGERVIAPIIDAAFVHKPLLVEEVVHRQQAESGNPEPPVVLDHRRCGETGVSAAQGLGNSGVLATDSLDMNFIEYRVGPGYRQLGIATPVEVFVDDTGFQAVRRIVLRRP